MDHNTSSEHSFATVDQRVLALLRYWDSLRGNRPVPARVEVSPAQITRHLSRICILERPRAGTVRIRLTGAILSERMGMELRGMPFRSLFDLEHRAMAMDAAEAAIVTPHISVLSLDRATRHGPQHEAQMAILPLSDTRGGLSRAIALYSELPSAGSDVRDLRGRFQVSGNQVIDIPETGPLRGLSETSPIQQLPSVSPTRLRRAQQSTQTALPRIEARVMEHHARPVFQVIEGGLA